MKKRRIPSSQEKQSRGPQTAEEGAACPAWVRPTADGVRFLVVVQPRAGRSEVVGVLGDRLKIRLASPPVDGRANRELVDFIRDRLGVGAGDVVLVSGSVGRRKTVRVTGISAGIAVRLLAD